MEIYDEVFFENGLGFYQEKEGFRFGNDIVLLAEFITEFAKPQQKNLEIGTGNGILPVLLSQKGFLSKEYFAVDILESNIVLAQKMQKRMEFMLSFFAKIFVVFQKKILIGKFLRILLI